MSLLVCAVVCAYPLVFTKVKNSLSSVCQELSHYLSSFRQLSKSVWIVFLFQSFSELATVASFENYPIRIRNAQVQSPLEVLNSSREFFMLLVSRKSLEGP